MSWFGKRGDARARVFTSRYCLGVLDHFLLRLYLFSYFILCSLTRFIPRYDSIYTGIASIDPATTITFIFELCYGFAQNAIVHSSLVLACAVTIRQFIDMQYHHQPRSPHMSIIPILPVRHYATIIVTIKRPTCVCSETL